MNAGARDLFPPSDVPGARMGEVASVARHPGNRHTAAGGPGALARATGGIVLAYHLVPREEFDERAPEYLPAAYGADDFVHTTRDLALLPVVANRYYRADPRPYLLLTIELDRATTPWRYDAAGEDYPHRYGPLNRDAIVAVRAAPPAADGTFLSVLW
jgi:uncharacterized protein (DUF952 family)